jgi:hypothetical protein
MRHCIELDGQQAVQELLSLGFNNMMDRTNFIVVDVEASRSGNFLVCSVAVGWTVPCPEKVSSLGIDLVVVVG